MVILVSIDAVWVTRHKWLTSRVTEVSAHMGYKIMLHHPPSPVNSS
jgi:hypothetical protein